MFTTFYFLTSFLTTSGASSLTSSLTGLAGLATFLSSSIFYIFFRTSSCLFLIKVSIFINPSRLVGRLVFKIFFYCSKKGIKSVS
jgi:hypothetical protein